nr:unnamed protein product [Callosobruchus analis]
MREGQQTSCPWTASVLLYRPE